MEYLKNSLSPFHACACAEALLKENGFCKLSESEDWQLAEGENYYVERGSALIAFTVGSLNDFSYKIAAAHTDSPALKLKENPVQKGGLYATLNVETYGGGIWSTFLDRPLKIVGRVVKKDENRLYEELVVSPFTLVIPSVAIHQNRNVNEGVALNAQVDLQPLLCAATDAPTTEALLEKLCGEGVISYDLYLVNADMPYTYGINDEYLASPRIDNLTSAYAAITALVKDTERNGVCVATLFDNEEVGNLTRQGADGDFLETVLRRITYALRFDDNEYYKALASSFLLSVDNAHSAHPNHPEKADTTNKTRMGGGIVIKYHANRAYTTDAISSAVIKTIFDNAGVQYQPFFNRSDMRSGSTLGGATLRHVSIMGADIGMAQLAMHSACETCALADYQTMVDGITAFYGATIKKGEDGVTVE